MLLVQTAFLQNFLDISDRKDVQKLRDVRAYGKPCALVFVEGCHLLNRNVGFRRQRRDDSLLIGRLFE